MAENLSTPRITSQYLDSFRSKTIRMVGKVTQLRGEEAMLDSEGPVTVFLNRVGNAVEIVGKVNQDLSVKVLKATDMGSELSWWIPIRAGLALHGILLEVMLTST